jgi:hypothetical protein
VKFCPWIYLAINLSAILLLPRIEKRKTEQKHIDTRGTASTASVAATRRAVARLGNDTDNGKMRRDGNRTCSSGKNTWRIRV